MLSVRGPRLHWWQEVAASGESSRDEGQILAVSNVQNDAHSSCQMVQEVTMENPVTCTTNIVKQSM